MANFYASDIENIQTLDSELDCWESKWSLCKDLPGSPQESLACCNQLMFPNIHTMLQTCTLPVTTSECKRTFSGLKRLKSYCRSTMTEQRLTGLAMLNSHHTMTIELDDIFARQHPRRVVNILND